MKLLRGELPLVIEGSFKPWAISVGHSKLLVRGVIGDPEGDDPLRVFDILFQDVSRIALSDQYDGIDLRLAQAGVKDVEERRVGHKWPAASMWLLSRERLADYVVAGRVYWAEVAVPAGMPSPLLTENPEPGDFVGCLYFLVTGQVLVGGSA
ncbi:hypothetical protein V6U90_33755 [Micromonospora sp. CPCC 206060]|uniref:hypothetical protein n=1 Tax=Micromonospora sp. CPCC 206060 TaxID=3122406 RepID=UPI002FF2F6FB